MPSALDLRIDDGHGAVTGPGGPLPIGAIDAGGRPIIANAPPTLPALFAHFCAPAWRHDLPRRGRGAADLRRDLCAAGAGRAQRWSAASASRRATGSAIAMRNAPAWIVAYMGGAEGGRRSRRCSTAGGRRPSSPRPAADRAELWSSPTRRARRRLERSAGCAPRRHARRRRSRSRRRSRRCSTRGGEAPRCPS